MQKVFCQTEAEATEKESSFSRFIQNNKIAFKLNYFGELGLHPGLEVGTDFTLLKRNWVTVHWDTGLGGYWHRWNNTSLFAKSTIGTRFHFWSAFVDLNAGVGYMHSFLAGTVYGKSENGGVEEVRDFGTSHFIPNASLLFGWDGTRKKKLPITVFVGPEVYFQSNFNHFFLPHVAAKVGVTYKFKKQ
ncbi:MAG: hypothetical protein ACJAV5_001938 [Vicingaceae bacterium]|jgi:hypothetical protein